MQQAVILHGDAIEQLQTLPAESVQCVVTSPPYFGLRDYGTAEWDGGAEDCDHAKPRVISSSTLRDDGRERIGTQDYEKTAQTVIPYRGDCGKCGATRIDRQIGLESTPAEYVAKMVDVFREVRRVLRKDGVCWLNIGDSYAGSWGAQGGPSNLGLPPSGVYADKSPTRDPKAFGLKPKDLIGIPWRLAFALQADGWYLRQDIIWAKPNPMPESVTDRCTKAHEYIFLLSKSERYYYDAAAISEPGSGRTTGNKQVKGAGQPGFEIRDGLLKVAEVEWHERNKRSVWTITTEPYPEAHFATFPTELPRICILAGSKIGDTILDPFAGSGTTLQVALELSRAAIGIELNEEYVALANRRLNSTTLGLPLEIAE